MKFRIGTGYDVHRLAHDRKLILGGVNIPHPMGLLGHSDADVLTHAVMDALLGAAGMGDIGRHFPDSDASFKGASSLCLLTEVGRLLAKDNWEVQNIDAIIVCQAPKLSPFRDDINRNIATALGIPAATVNIKFTTEEGLGFTGAGLGVAAQAVCMLMRY